MSDNYDEMLAGYDDVEPSQGFSGDPLPAGWYALKVEKILDTALSKQSSVPMVRMQLVVTEGKDKDKRAFVSVALGASDKNKEGAKRTFPEIEKAKGQIQAQMKGLLSALGVSTAAATGTGYQKVFNFYNVGGWEGRDFVGKIGLRAKNAQYEASNQLNSYYNVKDEKHGLAWLRAQGEVSSESATTTATAATI